MAYASRVMLLDLAPPPPCGRASGSNPGNRGEKSQSLMATMDRINTRMGRGRINMAGQGVKPAWRTRARQMSSHYTTNWHELPKATY